MGNVWQEIRGYYWNSLGEAIRGVEIVVLGVVLSALVTLDASTAVSPATWLKSVALAATVAAAAYVKGRLRPPVDGE